MYGSISSFVDQHFNVILPSLSDDPKKHIVNLLYLSSEICKFTSIRDIHLFTKPQFMLFFQAIGFSQEIWCSSNKYIMFVQLNVCNIVIPQNIECFT